MKLILQHLVSTEPASICCQASRLHRWPLLSCYVWDVLFNSPMCHSVEGETSVAVNLPTPEPLQSNIGPSYWKPTPVQFLQNVTGPGSSEGVKQRESIWKSLPIMKWSICTIYRQMAALTALQTLFPVPSSKIECLYFWQHFSLSS